jgi:hypothetical protein
MAFKAGTVAFAKLDGVNAAGTNIQPYLDNFSWGQTVATNEVSVFGTSAKAFITGLTDGDVVAFSGPYDKALYSILTAVKAAQAVGSATSTILWGPGGSVSGEASISAECFVQSVALAAQVGGRVELSGALQITGAVANTTF